MATWKNKPGIGLFIHAIKSGQKPSLTKPGCGWKEWADEAIKRQLRQYSQDGDTNLQRQNALYVDNINNKIAFIFSDFTVDRYNLNS